MVSGVDWRLISSDLSNTPVQAEDLPAVLPQPLRLPDRGHVRRREVVQVGKGGPPPAHDRHAFPQFETTDALDFIFESAENRSSVCQ